MTPDFIQGFYTCVLLEGLVYTVYYTVRLYLRNRVSRCNTCNSPNIDDSGHSVFPVESLLACPACGETMPKEHAPPNAVPIVRV